MRTKRQSFTFLFTDIERSSELWETHPQAMGRALAQHDDILRRTFEERGGHVFKTVGDAFCVSYSNARDAVFAAVTAQRALAQAAWEETGPLHVRMALHHGDVEVRDQDYFGPTLNRIARVLAVGHGGQTLLTRAATENVQGMLPDGVSMRDLGERRLKDLSQPERLFQLVIPDLPDNFPALRSLEILPNNLPAQVTSFIGREREMAEIKRLIGTSRLLTLTGPGGTGKTRLSLQLAAELLDQFPHGTWLVELSTLSDPALIPEAVINAVTIREEPDRTPLATLIDALKARRLLLVLDNCEHLIGGCAQLASAILRSCPDVKILASSREAFNIEGEQIWGVAPLPLPDFRAGETVDFDQIGRLEAVQLFVDRASSVRPDFQLTAENAELVARICWRLDGIPLALELAAARVKLLPLGQILERLDNRFRLLTGGNRAAMPRQQTLGALIDWSYDLLSEPERILFRRLAVFVGGRTLEMAEAVCSGEDLDSLEIFDLMNSLADKSLLVVESGLNGEPRYTMLESIWDYADERLTQHGEGARFRRRHLEYFAQFAETARPHLFASDQKAWIEKLAAEQYNLNRALENSLESAESIDLGLRLAGALVRFWEVRSYLTEGLEHLRELLARASDQTPPDLIAKAELGIARMAWCLDRDIDAIGPYKKAQDIYRRLGNEEMVGLIESYLGLAERNEGNNDQARIHFETAKAIGEKIGSEAIIGVVWSGYSSVLAAEGKWEEARAMKEKGIEVFRKRGDLWILSLITGSLGRLCFLSGDLDTSQRCITEALTITRSLGNIWSVPYAAEGLADIAAERNDALRAVRLYGAASTQREMLALAFSPTERAKYDQSLERLHALVPPEQFEEEWKAGRELTLEATVNLALKK